MYRTYGNLAVKPSAEPCRRPAPARSVSGSPRPLSAPVRPAAEQEERVLCPGEREMRRNHSARRTRSRILTVAIVLVVAAAGLMVVYRQSIVMQQNSELTKTLRASASLDIDTQVVEEKISSQTDLATIRALAISRLGMQDPAVLQRITVDLPLSDRLVMNPQGGTTSAGFQDDGNDVLLKSAMNDLEGFFRTLR